MDNVKWRVTLPKLRSISLKTEIEAKAGDVEMTMWVISGIAARLDWVFQWSWQVSGPAVFSVRYRQIGSTSCAAYATNCVQVPLVRMCTARSRCLLRDGNRGRILLKNSGTSIPMNPPGTSERSIFCFLGGVENPSFLWRSRRRYRWRGN